LKSLILLRTYFADHSATLSAVSKINNLIVVW
jgi:hypothetical protein